MKQLLILSLALILSGAAQSQTLTEPEQSTTPTAGILVTSLNLTVDMPIAESTNYNPNDIIQAKYHAPTVAIAVASHYELLIDGVANIQNTSNTDQTVELIVINSSPLCGYPYGTPQFGPGRVLTVTVPAGHFVVVPISMVDWINAGNTSQAHLQYRHASGPGLVVKANSYLDVKMVPASSVGVTNTPNEGPPFQPGNCPAQ